MLLLRNDDNLLGSILRSQPSVPTSCEAGCDGLHAASWKTAQYVKYRMRVAKLVLPSRKKTTLPCADDYWCHVQTVMFCFGALQALTIALSAALGRCACGWQGHHIVLPVVGQVDSLSLAASLPSAVTVIVWFCARRSSWAWPLQDAMGISLMLLLLRQFRLPNIKAWLRSCL